MLRAEEPGFEHIPSLAIRLLLLFGVSAGFGVHGGLGTQKLLLPFVPFVGPNERLCFRKHTLVDARALSEVALSFPDVSSLLS